MGPRRRDVTTRSGWRRGLGACALAGLLLGAGPTSAISTDPVLVLTRAVADSGAAVRVLRLEGVFPSEDLVQTPFALHILVRDLSSGTTYVRYDLSTGAFTGSSAALSDGFDPADAFALVAAGVPAPDARVALLARDRLDLVLPAGFPSGTSEAVLFVIHEGSPILSNAIAFEIGALAP